MPDRDTRPDKSASGKTARPRGADRQTSTDSDAASQPDPDSEQSTTARPRGHTEDPDKTL